MWQFIFGNTCAGRCNKFTARVCGNNSVCWCMRFMRCVVSFLCTDVRGRNAVYVVVCESMSCMDWYVCPQTSVAVLLCVFVYVILCVVLINLCVYRFPENVRIQQYCSQIMQISFPDSEGPDAAANTNIPFKVKQNWHKYTHIVTLKLCTNYFISRKNTKLLSI